MRPSADPDLTRDGAALHPGAALSILPALARIAAAAPANRAGIRLHGDAAVRDLLASAPIRAVAERYLGAAARPVRAILFDKSEGTNWTLGWHQDRTIVVRARAEVSGFGPWSVKAGLTHVEPPFGIVSTMRHSASISTTCRPTMPRC